MKNLLKIIGIFIIFFFSFVSVSNASFSDLFNRDSLKVDIDCGDGVDCNINTGIDEVEKTVTGIEKDKSLSEYIQTVVIYIITFVSLIAVIYIIYAGFRILVGGGDEENIKKQKTTILYVILGIVVIWIAYPLTMFIIGALNG